MKSKLFQRIQALGAIGRPAVIEAHRTVSHQELYTHARQVASHLCQQHGHVLQGERVCLFGPPGAAWIASYFGILLAGGTAVPISASHPQPEVAYVVNESSAKYALISDAYQDRCPWFSPAIVLPWVLESSSPVPAKFEALWQEQVVQEDDPAVMLFTSGTTGKPKGVPLSHGNVFVHAQLLQQAWGWQPDDVLLHVLPLHHLHGLGISLMTSILAGSTARMLERFDAQQVWENMEKSTVLMAVPTMYHRLLEALDQAEQPTQQRWKQSAKQLRLATSGSAALPVQLADRWREITGTIPLERYGMTEIGVGLSNPLHGERQRGMVGTPLPTVELRLVDESGNDVPLGTSGEIWVRGPSVFRSYFRREKATSEAFSDGWFRTGDTAVREASGFVKILGRTSVDIIKSGGYKLSALEIEEVIRDFPQVSEVAVVGIADVRWGERCVAAVVPKQGAHTDPSADKLREFCKTKLASYKVPRDFVWVAELPRNAVGKVVKPTLVEQLNKDFPPA
jgi:malonyl-CoA/methylmalonyl-CoA synthetase